MKSRDSNWRLKASPTSEGLQVELTKAHEDLQALGRVVAQKDQQLVLYHEQVARLSEQNSSFRESFSEEDKGVHEEVRKLEAALKEKDVLLEKVSMCLCYVCVLRMRVEKT